MATVTRENIGNLHDKITVKLAKEDYMPSFEKSLKQYAKTMNVPGFRKGMVPAGMVRKMYGQSIFSDEVLKTAGKELEDYLKKENLSIFAQPMVIPGEEPARLDMNAPEEVDFNFEIGLKPEFEIGPLKDRTALTRYKVTVTDELLNNEIDRVRRRFGTPEEQESVEGKDAIIYSTYELCDEAGNVAEDPEMVEDTELLEKMPAKLQEMIAGKKPGDSLVFRPADVCTEEELASFMKDPLKKTPEEAGQHYKITITKISKAVLAEMNEALFSQVFPDAEITDEAAFRALISAEISREYDRISRERLHNEIYELLVHQTKLDLPVDFLKRWLKEGGEKPKTDEEVEKEFSSFDHQLRWTLISDALISQNKVSVSFDEVKEELKTRVLGYFGAAADDDMPWLESYMAKLMKDEKTVDETYRRMLFERLFFTLEQQFNVEEKEVTEQEFAKLPNPHAAHHHHDH